MQYDQARAIDDRGHDARRLTDLSAQVKDELDRSSIQVQVTLSDRATLFGILIGPCSR